MKLEALAAEITPSKTVVFLGAGASVPSGGLTGTELAELLCREVSEGAIEATDLAEAASLLELQYGREPVVKALQRVLSPLRPDGGLLGMATLSWPRIYTTNYDDLVEKAHRATNVPLTVVRTNYDFQKLDTGERELLKIHGCMTRDRALGHRDSMVLTESDYSEYEDYREALFAKLNMDLQTKDVLIVGHSLSDPHLKKLIDEVAARARKQHLPNKIYTLLYSTDDARIALLADRNISAAQGSLADLLDHITESGDAPVSGSTAVQMPRTLLHRTIDCETARLEAPNAARMFNGGSATHGDIANGLTFKRSNEESAVGALSRGGKQYLTILGASGTGKSTLARRVLSELAKSGHATAEHKSEFELDFAAWLTVAKQAEADGVKFTLLIDDAAKHLAAVNRLTRALDEERLNSLQLILTAHAGQWAARSRSPLLTRNGRDLTLSTLTDSDVQALVDLCRSTPEIRALMQPRFATLSRAKQIAAVRETCKADMFVALKYCFPGEDIDRIILEEYKDLPEAVTEVYKCVALLEASHGTPSRQLVMEALGIPWDEIDTIIQGMQGTLSQRLIDGRDGIYTWTTRHRVIAETIAQFKFHDQSELVYLLGRIIRSLNASMLLDRHIVPALCDNEYAIGRVEHAADRIKLLELLASRSMNRVAWHRLISTYLSENDLPAASNAIARAEEAVSHDQPIHRYKIKLLVKRALELRSLGTEDYLALLERARHDAEDGIAKWRQNKYSYLTHRDVAQVIYRETGNDLFLHDSVAWMREAYDDILDRDLLRWADEAFYVAPFDDVRDHAAADNADV